MNRNSQSGKQQPSTSNSGKSRKASKDRDKRKSQSEQQQSSSEKNSSPVEEVGCVRQYAGISGESIALYAEQTSNENYPEEVCNKLAEDINYKLRQIIHTAMVKARLSGRNSILESDVEETFNSLTLDRVYGAPTSPEFIPFGDEGLYYLNDKQINIIDLAEQEISYLQPGNIFIDRKWVVDESEVNEGMKNYFRAICEALVGQNQQERCSALSDIRKNLKIGPIVDWFYNFAHLLLSYHSSCEHLTLCAFALIESLERNPVSDLSVSERHLNLLVRLLLQKIFSWPSKSDLLRYSCLILALLCTRSHLRRLVFAVLKEKVREIKNTGPVIVLTLVGSLGVDAVVEFFLPNADYFFIKAKEEKATELLNELLCLYNVIHKENILDDTMYAKYQEIFEQPLCQFSFQNTSMPTETETPETQSGFDSFMTSIMGQKNTLAMAVNLAKTRRKLQVPPKPHTAINMDLIFERDHSPVKIKFLNFTPRNLWERTQNTYKERAFKDGQTSVTLGRVTLLTDVFKNVRNEFRKSKCYDHSMKYYNI